jgi:GT2 family glycosyltransferase/SAM-dependent methyltransferase
LTDVAVSIVNTSNRELLLGCLRSLYDDPDRSCEVEVVVLDNGSDDGSAEAVRAEFPDARVIEQRARRGFGANHNAVTRATDSRYVFILNEDTEVHPGVVDALVAYLDAHPQVAAVGPRIVGPDGRQQGSAWRLVSVPVQLVWALTLGRRGAVVSRGSNPKRVGAVSACAMLVRRSSFERAGMLHEDYFIFSEEADLARRLRAFGEEVHYLPTVELVHYGQQTTSAAPERQINEHWRSLDLYLSRWHGPVEARVLRWLTGIGYGLALLATKVAPKLPSRLLPADAATWAPGVYRLHLRNAFRGVRGPGLRERAQEWNRDHGVEPTEIPTRAEVGWHRRIPEATLQERVYRALDLGNRAFMRRLESELAGCKSVLDVGCGVRSSLGLVRGDFYSVGLEAHRPALEQSRAAGIHDEYREEDARELSAGPESFDAVVMIDLLEHLSPEDGLELLEKVESVARKKVIVFTPNGWLEQDEYDGNPLQAHRSGWTADEFRARGYRVYGMNGWRPLRGELAAPRRPKLVTWPLSSVSQPFVAKHPQRAFHLLAVKDSAAVRRGEPVARAASA